MPMLASRAGGQVIGTPALEVDKVLQAQATPGASPCRTGRATSIHALSGGWRQGNHAEIPQLDTGDLCLGPALHVVAEESDHVRLVDRTERLPAQSSPFFAYSAIARTINTATASRSCLAYGAREASDEQRCERPRQYPQTQPAAVSQAAVTLAESLVRSHAARATLVPTGKLRSSPTLTF